MLYQSLKNSQYQVNFYQAVIQGLSPDKSLYFPNTIPKISKEWIKNILKYDIQKIAFDIIYPYIENIIPSKILESIIEKTLYFPIPLKRVYNKTYVLELFHGPTLSFKDIGAKFMAGCLEYFLQKGENQQITILVATSGDTGSAVAHGFYGVSSVEVIILYPSGRVSNLQEKQLTTLGNNITALEILGTFDDCQNLVKTAFLDKTIQKKRTLTSANSINIARWLPQMFYYFLAYQQLKEKDSKIIFSVPSGNFGNLCSGMLAAKMGLPVYHFIAGTNINDTIPRFLKSGKYYPRPTHITLSNAMDISNPSNFSRIWHLYEKNLFKLQKKLSSYSFTDDNVLEAIKDVWKEYNYMLDPHGAIGYMALQEYLKYSKDSDVTGIFLETAHPIKFFDKTPKILQKNISDNQFLNKFLNKEKKSIILTNDYKKFKEWLLKK